MKSTTQLLEMSPEERGAMFLELVAAIYEGEASKVRAACADLDITPKTYDNYRRNPSIWSLLLLQEWKRRLDMREAATQLRDAAAVALSLADMLDADAP